MGAGCKTKFICKLKEIPSLQERFKAEMGKTQDALKQAEFLNRKMEQLKKAVEKDKKAFWDDAIEILKKEGRLPKGYENENPTQNLQIADDNDEEAVDGEASLYLHTHDHPSGLPEFLKGLLK